VKVGIAIPCSTKDIEICFKYAINSIGLLNPLPHQIVVDINDKGYRGLKEIRTKLFDELFLEHDCDVVLSMCADYRLTNKKLLTKVSSTRVVSYGRFFNTPIIGIFFYVLRLLTRKPWSAMYSIPREIWFSKVRDNPLWNGYDGSIPKCVDMDFISNKGINYMLMRRDTKRIIKASLKELTLFRKMLKMLLGVKL
jgi:hypothetical protein